MHENDAYLFDVESPQEWIFTGEPVWVSGWFLSKVGAVFSDVRAVIDGVPHLGLLGLPRPDIEARHRGRTGLPHAGFALQLTPPRRARELRLELLDAGHRWVEIWRTRLKVRGGPRSVGRYQPALIPEHVRRLLQARRADPTIALAPLADILASAGAAVPLNTLPNPPFFGALERPEFVDSTQYGKVRVEGWLIHREQRIRRLIGSTHPLIENELDYGDRPRPEAALLFPDHPAAGRSQYFGLLDIDETAPGPALIKLFAELEDGTRHVVFARRFHPRACTVWERPLPRFDRGEFFACAFALRAAVRRLGLNQGPVLAQYRALRSAFALFRREAPAVVPPDATRQDPYLAWQHANQLTPRLGRILTDAAQKLGATGPKIVLLVNTHDCTPAQVNALGASLLAQFYPGWEARFAGPLAPATTDPRFIPHRHQAAAEQIGVLNAAAQASAATLLGFLPGHARLSPDALFEIAERFAARPDLELAYTDEDRMNSAGRRSEPDFKPEWSPAFSLSGLFPGQLCVVRRERFLALGGLREPFATVAWYDFLLRLGDALPPAQVAHVPLVCYHAWAGLPRELELSHRSYEQARLALVETLRRRDWNAAPFLPELGHVLRHRFHQLRWNRDALARLPVTIVIPTRDRLHLLQECVELLEETIDWRQAKLVIVDDHSRDLDALRYLEQIQHRPDLRCTVVRLTDPHAPFNYSRLVNAALPHVDTPLILHLNNDVNALEPGWLEEMAAWFAQADVGVVGAKLIYPDRSLNHTGIVIGPHGGLADTPWAKATERATAPGWHAAAREVSAVTGACLLTRTDLYRELGGFDEGDFGVAYNDVDYCLRVRATGRRVLYTPQAKLMHWGSATRGVTFDNAEHVAFVRRYPAFRDPYLSRHLRLTGNQLQCTPDAHVRANRAGRLRLLLITHNLNYEGAPLLFLEYATWMAREAGCTLEILSAQDGPLRAAFEALGARLTLVDAAALYAAPDREAFHHRLAGLAPQLDWQNLDLVVSNTLACFWGPLLAAQAGKPSLLYIHESNSPFRFFEQKLQLELHGLVHEAFAQAGAVLFPCQATRAYYEGLNVRDNFHLAPSWIRLDAIDAFRNRHSRAELRQRHGFGEDEIIIANIGTVCERKGQHVFVRAIDHFLRQGHRGKFRFVMVGARPGVYLDLLQRDIARLGLPNITFVPETDAAFDFFVAADLFVCSSFEESFPRVVMEAMAFRTPIVSTEVHGIADLIGQRQDGYLVPPGDALALARMMHTCLAKERSGKSLTPTAYSRILRFHDAAHVLPGHAARAREVFLADRTDAKQG